jgi:hypothetical protein
MEYRPLVHVVALAAILLIASGAGGAASPSGKATGTVTVNGKAFTSGPIAYGSTVDVTKGTLTLKAKGGTLTVRSVRGGLARFILVDTSTVSELKFTGGDFAHCSAGSKKVVRALSASGKGKWRTRGRYASGTVKGTTWTTKDTCAGTLTVVARGTVEVEDFTLHKTVSVTAGHRYTARPKG